MSNLDATQVKERDTDHAGGRVMGDGCQYCKGWERSHLQQQERIAELETELQRFKTVATVQAAILRGLTEWIETLPSQAWAIEKSTGEAAEV